MTCEALVLPIQRWANITVSAATSRPGSPQAASACGGCRLRRSRPTGTQYLAPAC
ncbi:hypothetical protein EDWATA_01598 [Edwardsiella tarda ATCC 23685]|uniref:Uncharacterized protein n=1 Tax=Edwardsiella tarda ATCC 23685 TaxID=500638 RepID=D4F4C8_EDWTA|nr:hypothetical protein EDWATA_01598 [Edwardsiella tarda ATCC 23685]